MQSGRVVEGPARRSASRGASSYEDDICGIEVFAYAVVKDALRGCDGAVWQTLTASWISRMTSNFRTLKKVLFTIQSVAWWEQLIGGGSDEKYSVAMRDNGGVSLW